MPVHECAIYKLCASPHLASPHPPRLVSPSSHCSGENPLETVRAQIAWWVAEQLIHLFVYNINGVQLQNVYNSPEFENSACSCIANSTLLGEHARAPPVWTGPSREGCACEGRENKENIFLSEYLMAENRHATVATAATLHSVHDLVRVALLAQNTRWAGAASRSEWSNSLSKDSGSLMKRQRGRVRRLAVFRKRRYSGAPRILGRRNDSQQLVH